MELIKEALTFDDVLLEPQYSNVLPSDVILDQKLSKNRIVSWVQLIYSKSCQNFYYLQLQVQFLNYAS